MIRLPVVAGAAGRSGTSTKTVAVTKRCVAIINPAGASGKSKKLWCSQLSHDVRQQLTSNGYVLEECFTAGPGSAARLTSDEAAAGADVVLAVGGDGTIHEVHTVCTCLPLDDSSSSSTPLTDRKALLALQHHPCAGCVRPGAAAAEPSTGAYHRPGGAPHGHRQ